MEPFIQSPVDPSTEVAVTWIIRIILGLMVFLLFYGWATKTKRDE
jgi:hypothetical protein